MMKSLILDKPIMWLKNRVGFRLPVPEEKAHKDFCFILYIYKISNFQRVNFHKYIENSNVHYLDTAGIRRFQKRKHGFLPDVFMSWSSFFRPEIMYILANNVGLTLPSAHIFAIKNFNRNAYVCLKDQGNKLQTES